MNSASKILISCGYVLGIGATLLLVFALPRLHETPVGWILGALVVIFMYVAGSFSLFLGLKTWMREP